MTKRRFTIRSKEQRGFEESRGIPLELTSFEREVMEFALDGQPHKKLRQQLATASVSRRELTGVGFFADFEVRSPARCFSATGHFIIRDVGAEIWDLAHGAGFLVFVVDGRLALLEGFAYGDERWPASAAVRRLYYHRPKSPDGGELIETALRDLSFAASKKNRERGR